jgi:alkylation response protein AidB-like acyl-CoA dehydrogenase
MPDTGYDAEQRGFASTIADFCAGHETASRSPAVAGEFPSATWDGLARLGVLGLTAPDSGAEPLDVVAAHEALGAGGCAGPLWSTALVAGVLAGSDLAGVVTGSLVASVGSPDRMPWAHRAELLFDGSGLTATGGVLRRAEDATAGPATVLLDFEPAARVEAARWSPVPVRSRARAVADLALGAYLTGSARRVLSDVTGYVRTRTQFRRTLAQFQAVAHPLAQCDAAIAAASALVRRAASRLPDEDRTGDAGIALGSAARAARRAVYQAHQSYGGVGFAEEGPLSWMGARIGRLSTLAEALWRQYPVQTLALREPGRR